MAKRNSPAAKKPALDRKARAKLPLPPPPPRVPLDRDDVECNFNLDPEWSHIQTRTKAARRRFLMEYIKDFNAKAAALRTGFVEAHNAASASCRWLAEPFTQWLLDQILAELKEDAIVTRQEILAGLKREACSYEEGAHGSRVKAWATLAKLKGMEVLKVEGELNVSGKVMTVPLAQSPEEFEAIARFRQAKLKKDCADANRN
jgi:hypothetical protein